MFSKQCKSIESSNRRSGLVLLVVLGMLALFSLLAISFLTISSHSQSASQALVKAKLQKMPTHDFDIDVVRKIIRGDTSNQSGVYGHSLLEDVYGRDAIQGQFDPSAGSAVLNTGNIGILKVQLLPSVLINPDPYRTPNYYDPAGTEVLDEKSVQSQLSVENDTYIGRIITFLEGPLANQSYRILGYIGTPALDSSGTALPNFDFSIAIDLSETNEEVFQVTITQSGLARTFSGKLQDWLQFNSNNPSIFTADNGVGYRYLINDLPFNGIGYGVERDQDWPTYGNLDQSRLVPGTQITGATYTPGFESFPLALLPNYDYLFQNSDSKAFGQGKILSRSTTQTYDVVGSTDEGSDVPDFQDFWLASQPETVGGSRLRQGQIIPSFHRPELVNYIAQYYGALGTVTPVQIVRMVQLIDYACARPLSYHLKNCPTPNGFSPTLTEFKSNLDFSGRRDSFSIPTLEIDFGLTNGQAEVKQWIKALIGGGASVGPLDVFSWDVDNDGDGVADSVWLDPNLPYVTSPEGRRLKALAAVMTIDMDGRLNINAVGDPYQRGLRDGTNSYRTAAETGNDLGFFRSALSSMFQPQGLGYGPAEVSLDRLFGPAMPNFLNMRYGSDQVPGKSGQERLGQYFQQREIRFDTSQIPFGLKQSRHGRIAYGIDRLGNPRMSDSQTAGASNELVDDAYEVNSLSPSSGDALVTLEEIEAILRRYDTDASKLPDRVRNTFASLPLNDSIYSSLTARSIELRYPNMAALSRHARTYTKASLLPTPYPRKNSVSGNYSSVTTGTPTIPRLISNGRVDGSFLRWVQMLYDERFPAASNPPLNMADIRDLFPLEFRKAMRLDLNRPFGNGLDDNADGMIDEPSEIANFAQGEHFPTSGADYIVNGTYFTANFPPNANDAIRGNIPTAVWNDYVAPNRSRKMMARQLYVLAQLVVEPDYPFGGFMFANPSYQRLRARELAQWAVNVVDFRDSDGTMTRFEYDETPFATDPGDPSVWFPKSDMVVWGMEFPELLMTETLAFHDKKVKDTANDGTSKDTHDPTSPDNDFDQYRLPQGSAYIEFYSPRSPNSVTGNSTIGADTNLGPAPSNLYTAGGNLQLSKTAPTSSGYAMPPAIPPGIDYGVQPVFRVGIARLPVGEDPGTYVASKNYAVLNQRTNQASIAGIQASAYASSGLVSGVAPVATNNFPTQTSRLQFDRILWFTSNTVGATQSIPDLVNGEDPADPNFAERQHRVFRNAVGLPVTVSGGGYLVVGPRAFTPLGSLNSGTTPPDYEPSPQAITIGTGSVAVTNPSGTNVLPAWTIQAPATMIAVTTPPSAAWLTAVGPNPAPLLYGVGFNISEPTPSPIPAGRYYNIPTQPLNSAATTPFPRTDSWRDVATNTGTFFDEPFDYNALAVNERLASDNNKHLIGTYAAHRTAFLQRLADPDLAYHPVYNPYITIDWMNMDLTVFNGEDLVGVDNASATPPYTAPAEEKPGPTGFALQSRYKDGARVTDAPDDQQIVTQATATAKGRYTFSDPSIAAGVQTGLSYFSSSTAYLIGSIAQTGFTGPPPYFAHSLGVVDPNAPASTTLGPDPSSVTLGYINAGRRNATGGYDGFAVPSAVTGPYMGSSQFPQAGLFWLNRPFASPYEIMMVPRTAPGQLGQMFSTPQQYVAPGDVSRGFATGQYDLAARSSAAAPAPWPTPYAYLPQFFSSPEMKVANTLGATPYEPYWQRTNTAAAIKGSSWNLLLELVETAPVFADSERWIHPNQLSATPNIQTYLLGTHVPPFNHFSTYRVAGKTNVNTVANKAVWESIEFNYDSTARNGTSTRWDEFKDLRRGYVALANTGSFLAASELNTNLDASTPSQFRGALRSPFQSNINVANQPGVTIVTPTMLPPSPIQPETMRLARTAYSGLLRPNVTSPNDGSLLAPNWEAIRQGSVNALNDANLAAEFSRSPFLNYQRIMRLPNLVTNQSNVFAVWVTVGLFEYDEIDGIGAEYIGPSGTPERTKSFYIIDRSIPVGFAPGKSYNSDKTILLRRKIPR